MKEMHGIKNDIHTNRSLRELIKNLWKTIEE